MKILITLLKPLSFLPALLMMYIIFSFSAQPGEVSGNLSYKISYEIIETKSELLSENLSSEEIAYKADGIHYYVRKAAHMTEYFLLAIAISFPLYVYGVRGIWLMLLAGIVCVGFAEDAQTTWSQGDMRLTTLVSGVQTVLECAKESSGKIAGVDICGEADAEAVHENEANDYANEKLLEVFEGLFGKSDCE